jgi:hypothetical protein
MMKNHEDEINALKSALSKEVVDHVEALTKLEHER